MKKKILVLITNALLFHCFHVTAQWHIGGDNLKADSRLGSNNAFDVLFETDSAIRGRLTRVGLWGIGNNIIPNARLHVNSLAGENALRVQVAGSTKLLVNSNGGVSVGSLSTPPVNGLHVSGRTGIGTNSPASTLDILGGNWDVGSTEGDFRIGNSTYRLKIGMATGGGGAGDARIRAVGGTNRIMLGVNDALTINGSGNVGIGTTTPDNKLHIMKGSAGLVAGNANSPLVVENSTSCYVNVLAPNTGETGILFGNPSNNVSGGIVYNSGSLNGMQFRTNGNVTRMTLTSAGHLIPTTSCSQNLGSSALPWNFVWSCNPFIQTSDIREKRNIRDLDYGIKEIMKLHPVRYNWQNNRDQSDRLGIIAQEIKKVLPEVVRDYEFKEDEKTGMVEKVPAAVIGVAYSEIIPVLIRSIQQQQEMIEAQNKKIEELSKLVIQSSSLNRSLNKETGYSKSNASLEQNVPNPFTNTTTIRYTLPQKFTNAKIVLTDESGKALKEINLSGTGKGSVGINTSTFSTGIYFYSLYVDGRLIASKQMILAK